MAPMALIDILITGLILAVVVSRFIKFDLPKDPRSRKERKGLVEDFRAAMGPRDKVSQPGRATRRGTSKAVVDVSALSGMDKLKTLDSGFDEQVFKDGTASAYRYFYQSWNAMDVEALDKLCGPELLAQLEDSLDDYRNRGAKPQVVVNDVRVVDVVDADVKAKTAVVRARITAFQSDDEVVAKRGATQALPHEVVVEWVLARPLTSDDPNWELQRIDHVGGKA